MISDDSWRTDEERPSTVLTSSAAYHKARAANLLTHYVMPGTTETLCCEQIRSEDWLVVQADHGIDVPVGCRLCTRHRYWLPASGELERNAILEIVIEPRECGVRKHVTGNDDPERGRFHRPETLQICLACGMLRGPYAEFDNLCSCDRALWVGARRPRCGDLSDSAHLCCTCTVNIVGSASRWSVFHCDECRPATRGLRERLVGNPIPWGWHSLTNGIGLRGDVASKLEPAGWTAFHDQLQAQFSNQSRLFDLTERRTLERAAMLGFDGPAVSYGDYSEACKEVGFGPRQGFEEFLGHVLGQADPALAAVIWDEPS